MHGVQVQVASAWSQVQGVKCKLQVVEVQKLEVFVIFNMLARPSAGIGVVEVQKLEVFCDF